MDPTVIEQREDFREHLTLGLVSALGEINTHLEVQLIRKNVMVESESEDILSDKIPGVQDVCLLEHQPCDNIAITSWEQRYSTILPQKIRDFYLATDGFRLTWNFRHAGDTLALGNMMINRIADLRRIGGIRHRFDTEQPTLLDLEVINRALDGPETNGTTKPQFGPRWKMFELDACDGNGRVCLVFPPKPEPIPMSSDQMSEDNESSHILDVSTPVPQVWYLDRAYDWHFLAPNFAAYFRMMLVHLGLPQWQLLFTPFGPTPRAKQVINLIAPHLLEHNDETHREEYPMTAVDPTVFRSRSRSAKKTEDNS